MSNIANSRRLVGQIGRFVVIGSLSAATDLGCYYLFTAFGMSASLAKGFSFVLGMLVGWVGNKFWTFATPGRKLAEPIAYVILYAFTLTLNVLVNDGAFWVLSQLAPEDWAKASAAIVATGTSAVANFVGLRCIVFAHKPQPSGASESM